MPRNPFSFFFRRQPRRRPLHSFYRPGIEELERRLVPSANVLSYHNDNASTGANLSEMALSPANVKVGSFGKIFTTALDGQTYAQPLVENGVSTATGLRDLVFVATEHDSLYAIDADDAGLAGTLVWSRSFLTLSDPTNNTLNATAIAAVPSADTGTSDIYPEVGITGTPVIDPATNTLYVVAKTKETINGTAHYVQRLHAINVADGTDRVTPFLIGDTVAGNTNNTPIYVYGSGDGSVIDPYNGTGNRVVQFNALREHQRAALSFVNNRVYVAWASHGDNGPYHGLIAAWDVSNLAGQGLKLAGVLNVSPNDGESGVWQGGAELVFEADGSAFYFLTGNGTGGAPTLDANGFPTDANYNEALVKAVADPTTSPAHQNLNGWGLKVADYFIPHNVAALDSADSDFGSGAPVLLPDSAGIAGHPHLMVVGGKEGKLYVIDRDNLGKFDPNNDHVVNAVPDGSGHLSPPVAISGLLSAPAWYNGRLYVLSGYSGVGRAFMLNADGTLAATSQTTVGTFGYLPGSPSISANGTTGGIVWMLDRNANLLRAYDASTLTTELWDSGQAPGNADAVGAVDKFGVPTVTDGQVFVATLNSLVVYGLTPPASTVPNAPTSLTAIALSGSAVQLTWGDGTSPPNIATGYSIEESTDGTHFTAVTTAPSGATSISLGGLQPSTQYWFRIRGFNGVGNSAYSGIATATTTTQTAVLDFSGGFVGSSGKLVYNGSAQIVGSRGEVTPNSAFQAGSIFSASPVDVTNFATQFTFQVTGGGSTADGFTFTIQGNGPTALGPIGGGLGYGADTAGGPPGIGKSVAVKFDLYSNQGEGPSSTGLYLNGAAPTSTSSIDLSGKGIDLHSGHVFQVNMQYNGTALTVTITDTSTGASATQSYTVDIPTTVGGGAAYVGFTGGTGGLTAAQDILTWTYSPTATSSPAAPSGLGATPASAASVNLTWTNNAANQTGFHLDRATDAGFTQNLITETLPSTSAAFTDSAIGLAPGGTYYYRLRAYNSAGDSGSSNVASVTIPVAPPKATDQVVENVTSTEIDIQWTDNAGHAADGYKILRKVGTNGTFTQVATLPPTSRTPPSTYDWADTNLTPGTYYEYHIVAYNVSGNNDFAGLNAVTLTQPPLAVTATQGTGTVTLTWSAPTGAVAYNVYRGTTPGGESATPLAANVAGTTYTDTTAVSGTTYYYVVTALNGNLAPLPGESAPSVEVHPGTSVPAAPQGLTAVASSGQVALSWSASSGATSYTVYRGTATGGETQIASGVMSTGYLDAGRTNGVTYYYQVTASNAGGPSGRSNEVSATPQAPAGNSAAFVGVDSVTQGNWTGSYGADGYSLSQSVAPLPSYATVSVTGSAGYTWNSATTNARALQVPGLSSRIAACWFSGGSLTIDVNLTDGKAHQVALYALDWDSPNRSERIDVLDAATGVVLDSRTISGFNGGQYLSWTVSGHVKFQVTRLAGDNAVISGLFFGPGAAVTPTTAAFVATDSVTQGNWTGSYGADGYSLSQSVAPLPSYATVSVTGAAGYTWNAATTNPRALQVPGLSSRIAACWFSGGGLSIDVNLTDGKAHQVALYALDWDSPNRSERVDVLDAATSVVLDSRTVSGFNGGQYLSWTVSGHVKFQVTRLAGDNAVISGLFFGPGAAVNLAGSFNREGIVTDGTTFTGGFDGAGSAVSARLLGSAVSANGQTFLLGAANVNNVVSAVGQTISLPSGNFSLLGLLAAGVNGNQQNQLFTVTYTDGTTQSFTQSISDWGKPQNYTGESTAAVMAYVDTSGGGTLSGTRNVYSYQFTLNRSKTVKSITLPNDLNVEIFALTLTA